MKRLLSLLVIFSLLLSISAVLANASEIEKITNSPRPVCYVKALTTTNYQTDITLLTLKGDNSPPVAIIKDNNSKFRRAEAEPAMNLQKNKESKKNSKKEEIKRENFMKEEYVPNIKGLPITLRL